MELLMNDLTPIMLLIFVLIIFVTTVSIVEYRKLNLKETCKEYVKNPNDKYQYLYRPSEGMEALPDSFIICDR